MKDQRVLTQLELDEVQSYINNIDEKLGNGFMKRDDANCIQGS
jgi:hypothetical protein